MDSNQVFKNQSIRYIDPIIQARLDAIENSYQVINWFSSFTSGTETIPTVQLTFVVVGKDCTCYMPAAQITRLTLGTVSYESDSIAPNALWPPSTGMTIVKGIDAVGLSSGYRMGNTGVLSIFKNASGAGNWSINVTGWDDTVTAYKLL